MVSIETTINIVDAVCDCTPVISTITNGAQLLYKLARKVDEAANPVNPTWKDEVKIHLINKTNFECFIGMIPIIGNLTNFIYFIIHGLRNQLNCSVVNSKTEAVKLYLARHPLNDDEKAKEILSMAAWASKIEVFKLIFESREWDIDSFIRALERCRTSKVNEEKATLLLDYFDENFTTSDLERSSEYNRLDQGSFYSIGHMLEYFIKDNKLEIVSRILNILPRAHSETSKESLLKLLAGYSYRSYNKFAESVLKEDQINEMISRCQPCKLEWFTQYCGTIYNAENTLKYNVESQNEHNRQYRPECAELNKEEIVSGLYKVHKEIIQELLKNVEDPSHSTIIDTLSFLAHLGQTEFLEVFLEKYEDQLTVEDKIRVIHGTQSSAPLEYLFRRYKQDLSDENCIKLLNFYFEFESKRVLGQKILEMRPDLAEKFNQQQSA